MSFAYLPLFVGDYLKDTQHLSCAEHGIYLKLLMHCWTQGGPAPLDERKQIGIVNARSGDEVEALRRVLAEFFVRMEDGHYQKRLMEEIERSNAISSKRSGAAKARWSARKKVSEIQRHTNAVQKHSKSNASGPPLTPTPREPSYAGSKPNTPAKKEGSS